MPKNALFQGPVYCEVTFGRPDSNTYMLHVLNQFAKLKEVLTVCPC